MSLESGEKQQAGRSVPLTASQQAAVAKNSATAEKVRNVVAKAAGGPKASQPAESPKSESKKPESKAAPADKAVSKPTSAAVAEPPEPVEDKAAAKARAKQEKAEAKARAKAEKAELKKAAQAERQRVASGGMKDIFVLHVEKIVLGISILAALGMIYAGIGKLSLAPNHHPSDMNKRLDGIDSRVKNPSFQSKENEFPPQNYDGSVGRFKVPVRSGLALVVPWSPPLVPPQKRGKPELYAPTQPIATAGNGVFIVSQLKPRPANKPEPAANGGPPPRGAVVPGAAVVAPGAGGGAAPAGGGDADLLIGGGEPAAGPAVAAAIPDGQPVPIPPNVLPNAGVVPPVGNDEQKVFPESRRWVSVVGLLPIMLQQAAFDKEFANAFDHDPNRDQPIYAEVRFLRLEVPPGTAENQLDWSKAKEWTWKEQLAMNKAEQRVWVLTAREVVPQKFIRDDTAKMPDNLKNAGLGVISKLLGPLVNQPWEPWATHPRLFEAPVVEELPQEAKQEEEAAAAAPMAPQQPDPDDPFGLKKPAVAPAPKKKDLRKKAAAPKARAQDNNQIEYQLVRVFDFTVEPGKQYRYKFQLMMRNPNFQIPARNLEDPKLASEAWLTTAWSEASNTVAVPDGQSVLADTVVRPAPAAPAVPGAPRPNPAEPAAAVEATARIVVKILNFNAAQETFAILTLRRGALAAGIARQIILNPLRPEVAKQEDANIRTDLVLADFRGGEKIEEGLDAPSEMLFIDAAGQLVIQNSVQDETWVKAVHELMKLFDAPPAAPNPMAKGGEAAEAQKDIKALQENAKAGKPARRNKNAAGP